MFFFLLHKFINLNFQFIFIFFKLKIAFLLLLFIILIVIVEIYDCLHEIDFNNYNGVTKKKEEKEEETIYYNFRRRFNLKRQMIKLINVTF